MRSGGGGRDLVFIEIQSWRAGWNRRFRPLNLKFSGNGNRSGQLCSHKMGRGGNWRYGMRQLRRCCMANSISHGGVAACTDLTVVTSLWLWEAWVSDRLRPGPFPCVWVCVSVLLLKRAFLKELIWWNWHISWTMFRIYHIKIAPIELFFLGWDLIGSFIYLKFFWPATGHSCLNSTNITIKCSFEGLPLFWGQIHRLSL